MTASQRRAPGRGSTTPDGATINVAQISTYPPVPSEPRQKVSLQRNTSSMRPGTSTSRRRRPPDARTYSHGTTTVAPTLLVANNGTLEFTDGTYQWLEGLAHYIADHNVQP